ncbi:hypothetical protein PspLS_06962 [Pyricularia sp. CBS 133598]|nr:hypothetical protein PspLS_06962 [Pyricularia sp. CBS 133598]
MRFTTSFAVKAAVLVLCATQSGANVTKPKFKAMCMLYPSTPQDPSGTRMSHEHGAPDIIEQHIFDEHRQSSVKYEADLHEDCSVELKGKWPKGYNIWAKWLRNLPA